MIKLLLKTFVKDYENTSSESVRKAYGTFAGTTGIILNILLFCAKLIAGVITGAISVIADAFNNLSDAGSSIITLIGFKLACKKGDKDHPFGHGRMEYITGLIVSFIIILVGVELLKSSVDKIICPEPVSIGIVPVVILVLSVLVKLFMAVFNTALGNRINSAALKAVATDSLSDVCATSAVIVGLIIGAFTGFNPDGYIGLVVAGFIIFSGIKAAKETLSPLLGTAPDPEFVAEIRDTVCSHSEIIGIHDMIIHDYGPGRSMVSLHAEVPSDSNIMEIHDTIDLIEIEIKAKFNCECTIHMDPIAADDEFANDLRQKLSVILGDIDKRLSFHDFRYVTGPTHTNLIFDVVAPFDLKMCDEELCEVLKSKIHDINESYFAVIQVDKDYTSYN